MGATNFNRTQCIKSLRRLGFILCNKRHGVHDKYCPPPEIADQLTSSQPHFIMIPRHTSLHCQSQIMAELKAMGGEDLVQKFREEL